MLNCDFKGCRFEPYYSPILYIYTWLLKKRILKKRLLNKKFKRKRKRRKQYRNLNKYFVFSDLSFFFFLFFLFYKNNRKKDLIVKYFHVYNYYDYFSSLGALISSHNLIYTIWNLKNNQVFVNLLNSKRKTIIFTSCGITLKIFGQNFKSFRRRFKGFFLVFVLMKKKILKVIKSKCLVFTFKKWKKISDYFLEYFIDFFTNELQSPKIFILLNPAFSFSKARLKKKKA